MVRGSWSSTLFILIVDRHGFLISQKLFLALIKMIRTLNQNLHSNLKIVPNSLQSNTPIKSKFSSESPLLTVYKAR